MCTVGNANNHDQRSAAYLCTLSHALWRNSVKFAKKTLRIFEIFVRLLRLDNQGKSSCILEVVPKLCCTAVDQTAGLR